MLRAYIPSEVPQLSHNIMAVHTAAIPQTSETQQFRDALGSFHT